MRGFLILKREAASLPSRQSRHTSHPVIRIQTLCSGSNPLPNKKPRDAGFFDSEREGFEPSVQVVPKRRFSKPLLSASQAPLLIFSTERRLYLRCRHLSFNIVIEFVLRVALRHARQTQ